MGSRGPSSHARPTRPEEKSVKQIEPISIAPIMRAVPKAHTEPYTNVLHTATTRIALCAASLHGEAV